MMPFFENTRAISLRALVLVIVAWIGTNAILAFLVGPVGGEVWQAVGVVQRATGDWVQMPLILSPFVLAIMVTVIIGVGRLRCSDVGWQRSAIVPAILVIMGFWVAMQFGMALRVVLYGKQLHWNMAWNELGVGWILGQLLAQLLGNALLEETMYRGFLIPQLYLKAVARFRHNTALAIALIGSSFLFAIMHIPHRLLVQGWAVEQLLGNQLELFLAGLIYGAVYLVTRNVFICVGLHSLWNQPARLLPVEFSEVKIVWYALVLTLLVVWPIARRYSTQRHSAITNDK